jgi:hypothetical protein
MRIKCPGQPIVDLIILTVFGEQNKLWSFSLTSCNFVPLSLSQPPLLSHPPSIRSEFSTTANIKNATCWDVTQRFSFFLNYSCVPESTASHAAASSVSHYMPDPPGDVAAKRSRAGDLSALGPGTDCGGRSPLQAPDAPATPPHGAPFWDE